MRKKGPSSSSLRSAWKRVLVVAHGSREASANREFVALVRAYRKKHPGWTVAHAYLELASPSVPGALRELAREKGSGRVLVLPLFLFAAKHVKEHLPRILRDFRKDHPGLQLRLGRPLSADPRLLDLLDPPLGKR